MPNKILVLNGTAKVWKATGGDYAMTMASIANNAARQGAKGDLGTPRARLWNMRAEINMDVAPTAGNVVEFYWSPSTSATAGTDNAGGASGTDAAYKAGEEDEWKRQLEFVGALVLTNDADTVVQVMDFVFAPPFRYGMPVLVNKGGQALEGDDDSHKITLTPIEDEIQ